MGLLEGTRYLTNRKHKHKNNLSINAFRQKKLLFKYKIHLFKFKHF